MAGIFIVVFIFCCFAGPMLYDEYAREKWRERNRERNRPKYEHAHRCCSCDGIGHPLFWNKDFDCLSCKGTGLHIFKSRKAEPTLRNHEWTRKIV